MTNSTDQIYNLLQKYLFPILKFANVYVDDFGILRPVGQDPDLCYEFEGKTLVVVDSQVKYQELKSERDKYQIFNPFSIPKQTVFLSNLVMAAANAKDDKTPEGFVYDEDLDEYIAADENVLNKEITNDSGNIKVFEKRDPDYLVNTKITYSHTDKSGNPIDELASFSHCNVILALVGAMINLIKKFQKVISPDFASTEVAVLTIEKTLNKIASVREKERKEKPQKLHIADLRDEEELIEDMAECDHDGYFIDPYISMDVLFMPWDKRDQYDPRIATAKIVRNLFLPTFKTLSDEEEISQNISDSMEMSQFADIDFDI